MTSEHIITHMYCKGCAIAINILIYAPNEHSGAITGISHRWKPKKPIAVRASQVYNLSHVLERRAVCRYRRRRAVNDSTTIVVPNILE